MSMGSSLVPRNWMVSLAGVDVKYVSAVDGFGACSKSIYFGYRVVCKEHKYHNNTLVPFLGRSLTVARVSSNSKEGRELRNPDGSDTVFGFQCNERYLQWDDSATIQLMKIWVSQQLDTDLDEIDERLKQLSVLLPDVIGSLEKMKAQVVLELCKDIDAVAERLMELKSILPDSNVSHMVAGNFWLLKNPSVGDLQEQMKKLCNAMPPEDAEKIIQKEPRILLADLDFVFNELRRLLPSMDPRQALLTHGSMVLKMDHADMASSLLIDDGIETSS